jgi:putative Holliday junction resolvase
VTAAGRLLGVDHGTVRVGLAVCDPDRTVASPLDTYRRKDAVADAKFFRTLAAEQKAVGWVVGLPLHMSGDEGGKAKECRAFGDWLTTATGLPVAFQDERYTSAAAEEAMLAAGLTLKQRRERLDRVAAQFILQAFLDADPAGRPPG